MAIRDLAEPVRVGVEGFDGRGVHYGGPVDMICGNQGGLRTVHETDEEWGTEGWEDVEACGMCRQTVFLLLRWWHPRAELPDWARG